MTASYQLFCYVVRHTEHLTHDYTLKDVTAVTRLSTEASGVVYLQVKAFVSLPSRDPNNSNNSDPFERNIEDFKDGDMIYVRGNSSDAAITIQ